jgi:hypothetical protein
MTEETNDSIAEALRLATANLYYMSETDAAFEVIDPIHSDGDAAESLRKHFDIGSSEPTAIQSFAEFFNRLCAKQDWHDAGQAANVDRYLRLREVFEGGLTDLQVIRFGSVRVSLFVVGKCSDGRIAGVKTLSVET